jgi:hypothetical protein
MLEGERDANVLAARVSSAIGLSAEPAPQEEIFWAIRKLLEHLARERPLVVVVEDIHWAEPTLLDLLEHIVDWSRDAPFLLLCPARPELLDSRPAWGGGKLNATTILLEALPADATGRLIAALPGGSALPNGVVERIQAAAEGNPLYVEEFLAMLVDDGHLTESTDGAWAATADLAAVRVPASISALLAARLEQLDPAERAVAERASVVGRVFEAAAVNELADAALRPAVSASLLALVRKELVRPDRSELTAGDAFRFRHILIRDAAYAALPKAERAELHERFADWLERTAGERLAELEEIVGHHLEQAYRYRTELGETGPAVDALGVRAGERLAAAGRAAYERGDAQAAASLLEVAAERLDIATRAGREVRLALVDAVDEQGHLAEAAELAKLVAEASSAADDTRAEALARIMRLRSLGQTGSISLSAPAFGRELQTIRTLVDRQHDPSVVSRFWMLFGNHQWELSDFDQAADATVHGVAFAEKSGVSRVIEDARIQLAIESLSGPTPVAVALAQFDDLLSWPETSRLGRASVIERMAILRAMSEAFDEARQDIEQSESMYRELGARSLIGEVHLSASWVERLAGDLEGEVDLLNQSQVAGEDAGAEGLLGYVRARRALALARLGRPTDAYRDLELADLDDSSRAKIVCEFARGRLLLDNGDLEGALQASDRAEALTRRSKKFVNLRIEALIEIAAVTFGAGQLTRAVDSATAAEDLAAQKGNLALQRRARDDLVRFRHALD